MPNTFSDDIKQYLKYDLVDTSGMSENQLKEIPYTVIHTSQAKQLKLRANEDFT